MAKAIPFLVGILVLGSAGAALTQQPGDSIVVVSARADIMIGDKVVDAAYRGAILSVRKVQGNWFSVSQGTPGWIHKDDVLPLDRAVDYFSDLIRQNPKDAGSYFVRGNIRCQQGDCPRAIADYNQAILLNPMDSDFYNARGYAHRNHGDLEKAIADYSLALKYDPRNVWALNNRGIALLDQGELDKAIADFDLALKLNVQHTWAYYNRGLAYAAKKEWDRAIADFTEAARLDPKDATAFLQRGLAYEGNKVFDKALADFEKALELEPEYAEAYHRQAWILATCPEARLRDPGKSLSQAKRACELSEGKNGLYLATLAAAYAQSGNFPEAERLQTQALDLVEENLKAEFRRRLDLYKAKKTYQPESK